MCHDQSRSIPSPGSRAFPWTVPFCHWSKYMFTYVNSFIKDVLNMWIAFATHIIYDLIMNIYNVKLISFTNIPHTRKKAKNQLIACVSLDNSLTLNLSDLKLLSQPWWNLIPKIKTNKYKQQYITDNHYQFNNFFEFH